MEGSNKGFAFVKYEDARSCLLASDNMDGWVYHHPQACLSMSPCAHARQ